MCSTPLAASASGRGGNEDGSGAEAGGGDACLEMRKVGRGCIVDDEGAEDGCGCRVLGVSHIPRLCYHYPQLHETRREGGGKKTHTSSDSAQA